MGGTTRTPPRDSHKAKGATVKEKCPVCSGPYTNTHMVECTRCKKWVHYICGGITDENEEQLRCDKRWKCPVCVQVLHDAGRQVRQNVLPPTMIIQSESVPAVQPEKGASGTENFRSVVDEDAASLLQKTVTQKKKVIGTQKAISTGAPTRKPKVVTNNVPPSESSKKTTSSRHEAARKRMEHLNEQEEIIKRKEKLLKQKEELLKQEEEILQQKIDTQNDLDISDSENSERLSDDSRSIEKSLRQSTRGKNRQNLPPKFDQGTNIPRFQPQRNDTTPTAFREHENTWPYCSTGIQQSGPTMAQLSARQAFGKDLPKFSGNPSEWPGFISCYRETTAACGFSQTENLMRLQKALCGTAQKMVACLLTRADNVPVIIQRLKELYGNPERILDDQLKRVRAYPPLKSSRVDSILNYAVEVQNLSTTLEDSDLEDHRRNPFLMQELLSKLQTDLQFKWAEYRSTRNESNDITIFANWLYDYAMNLYRTFPSLSLDCTKKYEAEGKFKMPPKRVNLHLNESSDESATDSSDDNEEVHVNHEPNSSRTTGTCLCCQGQCKSVGNCNAFYKLNVSKRWTLLKKIKLCRNCLEPHSYQIDCPAPVKCTEIHCKKDHHPLLHGKKKDEVTLPGNQTSTTPANNTVVSEQKLNDHVTNVEQVSCSNDKSVSTPNFRYMPVIVSFNGREVETYAFMDEGSSVTLMNEKLANDLNLTGEKRSLTLKWTDSTVRHEATDSVTAVVTIKGLGELHKAFNIRVRTVANLDLPTQSLQYDVLKENYPHIRGLPIDSYTDVVPEILIGLDNWRLALPLRVKEGDSLDPIAVKCRLGWTLFALKGDKINYHSYYVEDDSPGKPDDDLYDLVKSFYAVDRLGVLPSAKALMTTEEARADELMKRTTKRIGERFQIGLLWKSDNPKLPDNKHSTMKRLIWFEKRLESDPALKANVIDQLKKYEQKGYIERIRPEKKVDKQWYLPVFTVRNPNKPKKVRLVWDAAAKTNGESLNSNLIKGMDRTPSLFGILLRMRQRLVALTADIEEMFHRVVIQEEDQDAQRFLWRDCDTSRPPDEYAMTSMTFGATCSPCCAQWIKDENANQFVQQFPLATTAIINNHYIDDWLDSFDTAQQAIEIAKQVIHVHAKGGFHIRNWRSNSREVMMALGEKISEEEITDGGINFDALQSNTEKVLGMWWYYQEDTFGFPLTFNKGNKEVLQGLARPTKRELLRIAMSIYDPLGLISNYLIYIKIILQELWRCKVGWDDPIPDEKFEKFKKWRELLPQMEKLRLPRCLKPNVNTADLELHVFTDASDTACATAVYLRTTANSNYSCRLIAAKTHVAPLKMTSTPRLELEAALMGARLADTIIKELELKFSDITYWTDSKTALIWIRSSEPKRFGKFVGFRIAEIQELTDVNKWRHVPSEENIADEATKWKELPLLTPDCRWNTGPTFLHSEKDSWPAEPPLEDIESVLTHKIEVEFPLPNLEPERYSNFRTLRRHLSLWVKFIDGLKAKAHHQSPPAPYITSNQIRTAENLIFKQVQAEVYADEIMTLKSGKCTVSRKSTIYKLSPYLDEDGILRIKGRIDKCDYVGFDTKRPIILPKNHLITQLLVRHYHDKHHHINKEIVVNEMRQRFWIPQLRVVVKRVAKACQDCKNNRYQLLEPEMGPLPKVRLMPFTRPFTYVGVDLFGPMYVTVKRSTEKRWGVLFTCLNIRAVHIEIATKLDTATFIQCLKNFMHRRGQPKEIFSDRGTNFVGAEKLLRQEKNNIDTIAAASHFQEDGITWRFNPPLAPHMGGAWERLVKSIKRSLYKVLPSGGITDPILYGCMLEAEYMVNCHPLTYMPIDVETNESLTPNHWLLGSSHGVKTIGDLDVDVIHVKHSYLYSQQFAKKLWNRWLSEYLPQLTRKTKFFEPIKPIEMDDIVVICDPKGPTNKWPKGRVIKIYKGSDGQVRSADIRIVNGIITRPVSKLAKLDVAPEGERRSQAGACCDI